MKKRILITVTASAILALTMVGSAVAGPGFAYEPRDNKSHDNLRSLIIEPGSDPSSVQLHFAGADRVTLSLSGSLEVVNSDGHIWHYRPDVYQIVNGKQKTVSVTFGVLGKDRVALHVSKFDPSAPLIVTPVKGPAAM